jgi:5'-nucleotidase
MELLVTLVDLDGVIANQRQGFRNVLARHYPHIKLPTDEEDTDYDFEKSFPEEHRELINSLRLKKNFFRSLPVIAGAKQGLEQLKERSQEVRIVTAPTWEWKHCVDEKYAWVEEHLGREWCGRMILTRDKTFIRGNILIDDSPSVSGVSAPEWTHILYDQPYNRNVDMPRVTWDTMDAFLEEWITK